MQLSSPPMPTRSSFMSNNLQLDDSKNSIRTIVLRVMRLVTLVSGFRYVGDVLKRLADAVVVVFMEAVMLFSKLNPI